MHRQRKSIRSVRPPCLVSSAPRTSKSRGRNGFQPRIPYTYGHRARALKSASSGCHSATRQQRHYNSTPGRPGPPACIQHPPSELVSAQGLADRVPMHTGPGQHLAVLHLARAHTRGHIRFRLGPWRPDTPSICPPTAGRWAAALPARGHKSSSVTPAAPELLPRSLGAPTPRLPAPVPL